jgi:hypothetical protein
MTNATTSHTTAGRTSRLLRRVDGIELPVAGTWTVPGNHATITLSVPRRLRRPESRFGRAREATVVISDDPDVVHVDVLFEASGLDVTGASAGANGPPIRLLARTVPGLHRWALSGELFTDTGVLPVRAALGYHGVWRRGDRPYGWFALSGVVDSPASSAARRLRLSFELLAHGPEATSRPVPPPSRSLFVGGALPAGAAA